MIYIIGEKKPIMTHCLRCRASYSEAEESQDIYYKGLCSCCQHKERMKLMVNYKKRYSPSTFRELDDEDPHTANNRRNQERARKRKLTKKKKLCSKN